MNSIEDWIYEDGKFGSSRPNLSLGFLSAGLTFSKGEVQVFDSEGLGKVLRIGESLQLTEIDEVNYHESLVHYAFYRCPTKNPKVLLVGGGDGCSAREILKHQIKGLDWVEINPNVIEAAKTSLPFSKIEESLQNPKVNLTIEDGVSFIESSESEYDIVLIDGSDEIGPSAPLYGYPFLIAAKSILSDKGVFGMFCFNSFSSPKIVGRVGFILRQLYSKTAYLQVPVPTYFCGQAGFYFGFAEEVQNALGIKKKFVSDSVFATENAFLPENLRMRRISSFHREELDGPKRNLFLRFADMDGESYDFCRSFKLFSHKVKIARLEVQESSICMISLNDRKGDFTRCCAETFAKLSNFSAFKDYGPFKFCGVEFSKNWVKTLYFCDNIHWLKEDETFKSLYEYRPDYCQNFCIVCAVFDLKSGKKNGSSVWFYTQFSRFEYFDNQDLETNEWKFVEKVPVANAVSDSFLASYPKPTSFYGHALKMGLSIDSD